MQMQGQVARLTPPGFPAKPIDYATLLAQFGEKYRQNVEKQVLAYETKLGHVAAERWRRLACLLMTLAPQPPKLTGMHTMQFFIPDGKYRKQVFALHAVGDGTLAVYARDILAEAMRTGILAKPRHSDGDIANTYPLPPSGDTLVIDALDGKSCNPSPFYKDMTGWNRRAICMTLPPDASDVLIQAVERVCNLAAKEWVGKQG